MRLAPRRLLPLSALVGGLLSFTAAGAGAGEPAAAAPDVPAVSLLDAARSGAVAVNAEGAGDGRMTLSVTNRTRRKLAVVLPPGLVVSGSTGQFGGMGGRGGGRGGRGGGMGGMGGGMGGMGMTGGAMPASMGMMTLSMLIMNLIGDRDSWDTRSMRMGGGMGMGGRGMGGMGMGGRGMGGGFRSVPPTGLPFAALEPGQTRHLPTPLVSLNGPSPEATPAMPGKGERLQVGDITDLRADARTKAALRRLAADKAPPAIAQMVLWKVAARLDWVTIGQLGRSWANPYEFALARAFVKQLDALPVEETGRLRVEVAAEGNDTLKAELGRLIQGTTVLGLKVEMGVPVQPEGPCVACKVAEVVGRRGLRQGVRVVGVDLSGL